MSLSESPVPNGRRFRSRHAHPQEALSGSSIQGADLTHECAVGGSTSLDRL
jgi:hypothetical protein